MESDPLLFDLGKQKPTTRQIADLVREGGGAEALTEATRRADAARYQFWRWREDAGWIEAQDDALRARSLPPGMAISDLRIETMRPTGSMRLEFAPEGSLAYEFQMSLGAARYSVAASPLGEVQVHDAQ